MVQVLLGFFVYKFLNCTKFKALIILKQILQLVPL